LYRGRYHGNDFNPRSQGGSDVYHIYYQALPFISIHAPKGGATQPCEPLQGRENISIHAPKGGATGCLHGCEYCYANFNPRSQGGSDQNYIRHNKDIRDFNPRSQGGSDECGRPRRHRPTRISIHAPKGGATRKLGVYVLTNFDFNPRSQGGSD